MTTVTIAIESQFKQLRSIPKKKVLGGFNGIRTRRFNKQYNALHMHNTLWYIFLPSLQSNNVK